MFRPLIALALAVPTAALAAGGSGTSAEPYRIEDCAELQAINNDLTAHYALTANIDCGVAPFDSGAGFTPIGHTANRFTGHFNGADFTISNLLVAPASGHAALFGGVGSAVIENVHLSNAIIDAPQSTRAATLIADALGSTAPGGHTVVRNVTAHGVVNAPVARAGGVISQAVYIKVSDSTANVDVTGDYAGGFIAWVTDNLTDPLDPDHTIVRCAATGTVSGDRSAGGFSVYGFRTHISETSATGDVDASDPSVSLAGGFSAQSHQALFTDVYADNNVTAARANRGSAFVAGPIGNITVTNAYVTGGPNVTGLFSYLDFESEPGTDVLNNVVYISQTDINNGSADAYYSSATPPLNAWDFTTVWASDGASFPTLRQTPLGPPAPLGIVCDEGEPYDWDNNGEDDGCLGNNANIDPTVDVPAGTRIGDNVEIGPFAQLGTDTVIGNGVTLATRSRIGAGNTLGNGVVVGRRSVLGDDNTLGADTVVGRSATVGSGNTVGEMSSIGYAAELGNNATVDGMLVLGSLASLGYAGGTGPISVTGDIVIARSAQVAATLGATLTAGGGVVIGPDSTVGSGSELGSGVRVRKEADLAPNTTIGSNARIGRGVTTESGVEIAASANISARVALCSTSSPFAGLIPRSYTDSACIP